MKPIMMPIPRGKWKLRRCDGNKPPVFVLECLGAELALIGPVDDEVNTFEIPVEMKDFATDLIELLNRYQWSH